MIVSKYGLHKDNDGVWWLLQGSGATNAIGLPAEMCDLTVSPLAGKCFHDIDLGFSFPGKLPNNGLIDFMAPVPKLEGQIGYLKCKESEVLEHLKVVMKLQSMFVPTMDLAAPVWADKQLITWLKKRAGSNLTTMVFYGDAEQTNQVDRIIDLVSAMKLSAIFLGPSFPTFTKAKSVTTLNMEDLENARAWFPDIGDDPVRAYGADVIREFMRR